MTFGRLLLRNLFYHWRGNLAVLLGVAVGTAVLTGALLVGDSLRGSLRHQTLERLGWVQHALVSGRFVREQLADEMGVRPAIALQGNVSAAPLGSGQAERRAGRVTIWGVTDGFWPAGRSPAGDGEPANRVFLNAVLAHDLGARTGDPVTLHVQKVSAVPRETLLGQRDASEVLDRITLPAVVLSDKFSGTQFSLNPSAATPRNAFVSLAVLQAALGQKGRVNTLLAGATTDDVQASLRAHLTLDDWGLVLHSPASRTRDLFARLDKDHDGKLTPEEYRRRLATHFVAAVDRDHDGILTRGEVADFYRTARPYLHLESRQMLLEPAVADAAQVAAREAGLTAAPTLVYLANGISDGNATIPYSIVAALDPSLPSPLGPFLPPGVNKLVDGEIVLAAWKDSPLKAQPGEKITLTYFEPEEQAHLRELTATFTLRGLVPMEGVAADPNLTPEFPGITDKLDIRDWNPPFPYDNSRVQRADERYWEQYRTTPKAYITLADGQKLWGSRFGNLTSIRFAPVSGELKLLEGEQDSVAKAFTRHLLDHLDPQQGGLVFDDVRRRGLDASSGFTDFGVLFLLFSLFLIAAALLLVGLLFRLNLDRRAAEIGLLLATGFRRSTVRWLLLGEGCLLAALGGLVGLGGAVLYAWLMLGLLRALWPGALDQSFLRLYVGAFSVVIGYFGAVAVSLLTIAWAVRGLGRVAPRALLVGQTVGEDVAERRPIRWSPVILGVSALGAAACLAAGPWVSDPEMKATTFFSSGALLLIAGLAAAWAWMRSARHVQMIGHGLLALARLGVRNGARHPVRSLLTAGLLASATFLVVAVESFHRDTGKDFLDPHAGSGGFTLLAESDVPLFQDLNSDKGRDELNFPDSASATLNNVPIFALRLRAGDDASCLNLYQPRRPRLLGVPHGLVEEDRFHFQEVASDSPAPTANPWALLEEPQPDTAIPVFGEANTLQWMLKTGLGQTLQVPDERGEPVNLRIVGVLQDSIFQSELVMSEANFLRLYPRQEGYQFFLIGAPPDRTSAVTDLLETTLANQGFTVLPTQRRLEAYLAVENTYLATFQALGGLGLVLGTFGLTVVLLRSVWERRGELALLRALGFRQTALGFLVLAENSFLLLLGLGIGTGTALLAVAPHLLSGSGAVPWLQLLGLLCLVLFVGLTSASLAVWATLQAPLLTALRRE
jgi:ABC-type antimicrobial peptide transport system permease subunit